MRYVIDLVRGKSVPQAFSVLERTNKGAAMPVRKLIQTAADAAKKAKNEEPENLFISKIMADQAGIMKRWRSMSMGRAGMIRKRLSHVTIELDRLPETRRPKAALPAGAIKKVKSNKTQKAGA